MRNIDRIMILAFCILMVFSFLGGCRKTEYVSSDVPTVLTVSMSLGEEEWDVMRTEIFPAFEEKYKVKIKDVQINAEDIHGKLSAMKQAGKVEIDLIAQDNMRLASLVEDGLVEDLSDQRSKIPAEVIPSLIKVGEFGGKLYYLPFRPNVEINFYNEKKFNEYGLKPPTNWDELLQAAKTFKEKEGIGRVIVKGTLDACTTVQLFEYIRQAGGDPLVLNDEGSVKAFTFLKELAPYLSPDAPKSNWNFINQFLANDSAYYGANWPFAVNVIVKDAGKTEMKAYEGFSGPVKRSKVLGGDVLGIPAGSPNKEVALQFAEYLMSKEVQEILVSKLGWPSSRKDANGKVEGWQKPYFDAVSSALESAEGRPNVTYWDDVDRALNGAYREITMEGKDVKDTLDKYHDILEAVKNKQGTE